MEDCKLKIPGGVAWVKKSGGSNRSGEVQKVTGVKNYTQIQI